MIDVLLAYPSHRRVLAGRTYSPLGLLYVAAILERDGFTVRVLDFDVDNPGAERLKQILEAERPKVVGINTLTTALPEVYGLVRFFRMNSGAVIVVGGSHVTCEPSSVEYLGADYGIRGEGEYSFLTLCRRVIRGAGALESIDGLVVKDSGMKYKPPAYVPELDALPFPARHLVHVRNYMFNTVLTSRGCPFNCIFCADVSTKVRSRSPANVVAELSQMISGYGLRRIDFADSVFTLDRQRVLDLCDLIKKNNLRFKWTCLTRCDLVDEELLSEMKSAGCFLVLFGVESGVEEVRARIGKLISDEKIREAFKLSRKIGLKTGVSVMFGHPNEKLDEMRKTIDFACSLKADYGVFSVSELMPGTKLFEIAVQEGYAKPTLWQDYMQGRIPHLYYAPKGVTFNDLLAVTAQAHKKFYHNLPHIIQRIQGIDSKIELDETINTIQNYVLDKAGM